MSTSATAASQWRTIEHTWLKRRVMGEIGRVRRLQAAGQSVCWDLELELGIARIEALLARTESEQKPASLLRDGRVLGGFRAAAREALESAAHEVTSSTNWGRASLLRIGRSVERFRVSAEPLIESKAKGLEFDDRDALGLFAIAVEEVRAAIEVLLMELEA